jgi:nucleoside-diphosphate-sugar epimerase
MRALITGIKGFTGHYVAEELERHGWEVWGLGQHPAPDDQRYHQVDLNDSVRLNQIITELQPQAVIHLAAVAFVAHDDPEAFYRVNLLGTRSLLEALVSIDTAPQCVLLASSANVYGNTVGGMLPETTLPNPANDYAVSKLAMEYMARTYSDRLQMVIVRPFNYTGVGQTDNFLLPKIVDHFRRRASKIRLGNLDVSRDFSDVRAVATAYRRLLETCPQGEVVNICSGHATSLEEVISMAEEITGHRMQIEVDPAFVRRNEVKFLCGDPTRLVQLIGDWEPPSLRSTLRWMMDN